MESDDRAIALVVNDNGEFRFGDRSYNRSTLWVILRQPVDEPVVAEVHMQVFTSACLGGLGGEGCEHDGGHCDQCLQFQ